MQITTGGRNTYVYLTRIAMV